MTKILVGSKTKVTKQQHRFLVICAKPSMKKTNIPIVFRKELLTETREYLLSHPYLQKIQTISLLTQLARFKNQKTNQKILL